MMYFDYLNFNFISITDLLIIKNLLDYWREGYDRFEELSILVKKTNIKLKNLFMILKLSQVLRNHLKEKKRMLSNCEDLVAIKKAKAILDGKFE